MALRKHLGNFSVAAQHVIVDGFLKLSGDD